MSGQGEQRRTEDQHEGQGPTAQAFLATGRRRCMEHRCAGAHTRAHAGAAGWARASAGAASHPLGPLVVQPHHLCRVDLQLARGLEGGHHRLLDALAHLRGAGGSAGRRGVRAAGPGEKCGPGWPASAPCCTAWGHRATCGAPWLPSGAGHTARPSGAHSPRGRTQWRQRWGPRR